jgi:hypothetical protein
MDADLHLVRFMLERAHDFEWSLQGFGMFRLYLSREMRLHVWDFRFAAADVTTLHTHPWDFLSTVISGRITDRVYREISSHPKTHMRQRIVCGPGGCATDDPPEPVCLQPYREDTFQRGQWYRLSAKQIHESIPAPGTITLIRRWFGEDTEHAHVFYPVGKKWVSAEPRKATGDEISNMRELALSRLAQELR